MVVVVEAYRREVDRMLLGPAYRRIDSEEEEERRGIVARRRVLGCIVSISSAERYSLFLSFSRSEVGLCAGSGLEYFSLALREVKVMQLQSAARLCRHSAWFAASLAPKICRGGLC